MVESYEISVDKKVIGLQHMFRTWVAPTENVAVFSLHLQLISA
jgi:hypothetical protein